MVADLTASETIFVRTRLELWDAGIAPGDETWAVMLAKFGRASALWDVMCTSYDWKHAPEEFPDGRPAGVIDYGDFTRDIPNFDPGPLEGLDSLSE